MKIFICGRTLYSFFTAVYRAYGESGSIITSDENIQLELGSEVIRVETDTALALRVKNAILKYDIHGLHDILRALRSGQPNKEQVIFLYIKRLMQCKRRIINAFNFEEVVAFNDILHKIGIEIEHIYGFLRFKESASGALYAPYSPDNDITELIMPHFVERLKNERFVIHDIGRKIAGVYNGGNCILGRMDETEIYLSYNEKAFESLWKKYYSAVNIKERPHEKQMKGSMPIRYWKFLPEKN